MKKNLLIIGALLIGSLAFFSTKKVLDVKDIAKNLKINIKSIKNIKISGGKLKFTLALNITNNTDAGFAAKTFNLFKLISVDLFTNQGDFLGQALTNIDGISLPPATTTPVEGIEMEVPLLSLATTLLSNPNPRDFVVSATFEIFGRTFKITQNDSNTAI